MGTYHMPNQPDVGACNTSRSANLGHVQICKSGTRPDLQIWGTWDQRLTATLSTTRQTLQETQRPTARDLSCTLTRRPATLPSLADHNPHVDAGTGAVAGQLLTQLLTQPLCKKPRLPSADASEGADADAVALWAGMGQRQHLTQVDTTNCTWSQDH